MIVDVNGLNPRMDSSSNSPGLDIVLIFLIVFITGVSVLAQSMVNIPSIWSARWIVVLPILILVLLLIKQRSSFPVSILLSRREKICLLLWVGISLLSVVSSDHLLASLVRQVEWFAVVGLMLTLGVWLTVRPDINKLIIVAIPFGFFLIGLLFLLKWFWLEDPRQFNWFHNPPVYFHIRHMGYHAAAAFACAYSLVLQAPSKRSFSWVSGFFLLVFSAAFVFWGGGRSGVLGMFLFFGYSFFIGNRQAWSKNDFSFTVLLAMLIGLLFAEIFWVDHPGLGVSLVHGKINDVVTVNQLSSGRVEIWVHLIESLWSQHALLGFGPDSYLYLHGRVETSAVHPHNFLFQMLGDWGIGALPMLIFLGSLMMRGFQTLKQYKQPPWWVAGWLLCLMLLFVGLVDGTLYHAWVLAFFGLGMAMLLSGLVPAQFYSGQQHKHRAVKVSLDYFFQDRGFWFLCVLIMFLHAISNLLQMGSVPKTPNEIRPTLVRYYPSHNLTVSYWYQIWAEELPGADLIWLAWLQNHSTSNIAWKYYLEEAELFNNGDNKEDVERLLRVALKKAPAEERETVRKELARLIK